MTEMTREIIIDLLPTYFAGEASEQTRRLVEEYFERDPEFARMARRMNDRLLQEMPVQLSENHQMRTLRRTKNTVIWQVFAVAVLLVLAMMGLVVMVFFVIQ